MTRATVCLIGVAAGVIVVSTVSARSQRETAPTPWDVDAIYPTEAAWSGEVRAVEATVQRLRTLATTPLASPEAARHLLDAMTDARGRAGRMAKVALLQSEVDTTSTAAAARRVLAFELERHVEDAIAPLERRIGAVARSRVSQWQRADRRLQRHDRRLRRIAHAAAFLPAPGREELTTRLTHLARRTADAHAQVLQLRREWPSLEGVAGTSVVTPSSFASLRRSAEATTRHLAHERFFSTLGEMRDTFATILVSRVEADWLSARERGIDDPIEGVFMLADGTRPGTVATLLEVARRHRTVLARATRALAAGVSGRTGLADAFAQSADLAGVTLDEARALALAAAEPLGPAYQDLLRRRFTLPWWHLSADERKSGTVGAYWQVGDGHPHVLLSFRGRHSNSRTLSAAAFLAMAYAEIPSDLAPDRRDEDLPIFGNAVWYLGQLRHDDVRAASARGESLAAAVVREQQYAVWNAYVRGVVLVAFEAELGARVRRGIRPTGTEVSQLYLATLREFVGGREGVEVPPYFADEWINEDTLFYGPYQATFPIAMATGVALHERVLAGDTGAIDAVRSGIARSRTHYSWEILEAAGLDLGHAGSYDAVIGWLSRASRTAPSPVANAHLEGRDACRTRCSS